MATLKCLHTAESLTTEPTSSSRMILRRSSGGRTARPNATGRDMAARGHTTRSFGLSGDAAVTSCLCLRTLPALTGTRGVVTCGVMGVYLL